MDIFIIAIFVNKILLEIISQMRLFSNFKTKYYEDLDLCIIEAERENQLVVFFTTTTSWLRLACARFAAITTAFFTITVFTVTRFIIASHTVYIIT